MGATPEASAARLRAARAAAPEGWLGCDGAWIFDEVGPAADFARSIYDVRLGWFEDIFPPGDAQQLAELRRQIDTPIAMGDEQGGAYYPQALIRAGAVDVVRIDLTCMGGITGALGFRHFGFKTTIPLALFLVLLAGRPLLLELRLLLRNLRRDFET